ncbi:hypothetical protein HW132_36325 [Brasilonema sp. CT11]|nr:hypothetical protein [Brasilonema sp. CT11]
MHLLKFFIEFDLRRCTRTRKNRGAWEFSGTRIEDSQVNRVRRLQRYNKHYNPHQRQVTSVFLEKYITDQNLTDALELLEQLGFYGNSALDELAHLQSGGVQ